MKKITKAVIPAAGFGTRFLPITKAIPKEMIPVIDKPVIHYVVEEAIESGFDDILIITGRNKIAIEDYFDASPEIERVLTERNDIERRETLNQLREKADIHYIRQNSQRGLGDAILYAKKHIGNEPFAVLLGDIICQSEEGVKPCSAQLAEIYYKYNKPVIGVKVIPENKIKDYGIISGKEIDKSLYSITDIVEKPLPENAPSNIGAIGRYILTPDIFNIIEQTKPGKNGEVQLTDALRMYNESLAFISESEIFDIGDIDSWIYSTILLLMKNDKYKKMLSNMLKIIK